MAENSYKFFCNAECEYYPCHKIPEGYEGGFNCLFCFCPLHRFGPDCGGNFNYDQEYVKDCSACFIPHTEKGYDYITKKLVELIDREIEKEKAEKEKQD